VDNEKERIQVAYTMSSEMKVHECIPSLANNWTYSENHQRFVAHRKVFLLSHLKPKNSFSLGVKCLVRNPRVPKVMLKEIKHRWSNCHDELEGALNWKAYNSDYFSDKSVWQDVDSSLWEPNYGYYRTCHS
jgi:hypothetical protein